MAYAIVQSATAWSGGASSNGSFSSLPTAGHMIVVELAIKVSGGNNPTGGVSDNQGNTYTQAATGRFNGGRGEVWYCHNISAPSGTFTITVTCAGAGGGNTTYAMAHEVSGTGTNNPLFSTATGSGGVFTMTSGAALVNPTAIAFATWEDQFAGGNVLTSGAPWTADFNFGNFGGSGAHALISSAGTVSVSTSSGGSGGALAVFQDPADFAKTRVTQTVQSLVSRPPGSPVRATQTVQGLISQTTPAARTTQIVVTYIARQESTPVGFYSGRRGIYVPTRALAGSEGGGAVPFTALGGRTIVVPPLKRAIYLTPLAEGASRTVPVPVQSRAIYIPPNDEGNTPTGAQRTIAVPIGTEGYSHR